MVRFFQMLIQRFLANNCLYKKRLSINWFMTRLNNKWLLALIITVGTVINVFKSTEARQKWVFKIKNRFEEKKQLAEQKKLMRSGGVLLDDIELASFHK